MHKQILETDWPYKEKMGLAKIWACIEMVGPAKKIIGFANK